MAYKDEYEVAGLYTSPEFRHALNEQFEGDFQRAFNLAPPPLSRRDAKGRPIKRRFPGSTMLAFKTLAVLRFLRGGRLDLSDARRSAAWSRP